MRVHQSRAAVHQTMLLLAAFTVSCTPVARAPSAGSAPTLPSRAAAVDSVFAPLAPPGSPGCAVGVYREGEMILARGYGVASAESDARITPQTMFNLGSASKPFTALAVLALEERGQLSLDDDVRRYIPELPVYDAPIRIRDLLQHTSGLRDYDMLGTLSGQPVATMQEFLDLLTAQRSLNFTPATRHEYSHSDFVLLAIVVERATGEPFGAYLEREVLGPLGLTSSRVHDARGAGVPQRGFGHSRVGDGYYVVFPTSHVTGGDNLYTSVEDLQRWDRALDQAVAGRHTLVARLLQRPTLPDGDTIPYAFGIRRGDHRGLRVLTRGGHSDGMRTEFIHFPGQRFGVAVLCNAPHLRPGTLGERIAAVFLEGTMQPPRDSTEAPPFVQASAAELERYAGVYGMAEGEDVKAGFTPDDVTSFAVMDGRLGEVLLGGDTIHAMTYRGDGRFTFEGAPAAFQVRFVGAGASGPMRAEFSWEGEVQSVMERMPDSAVWRPDAVELAEYAGVYHSPELDTSWELLPHEGRLVLRRRGARDLSLTAVHPNLFTRPFGPWESLVPARLEFARDASGAVAGLTVSTSGDGQIVRGVRFDRTPPGPGSMAGARSAAPAATPAYLYVWTASEDTARGSVLAVFDIRPGVQEEERLTAMVAAGGQSRGAHHTEHALGANGLLFANAFRAGRSFLFDVRDPRDPRLLRSFGDVGPYAHPHSFERLPGGNTLVTFQWKTGGALPGGLVELDREGQPVRWASAAPPSSDSLEIVPYSLVALPGVDRVVTSSTHMIEDIGVHVQVWRLSDLTLLHTLRVPLAQQAETGHEGHGAGGSERHRLPAEPRVLADGRTVMFGTFTCGLYHLTGVETEEPQVVYSSAFEGADCGVPVVVGRWWIQTVPSLNAIVALDVSDPAAPIEGSRLVLPDQAAPHWLAADASGRLLVTTSASGGDPTLRFIAFDPRTGALSVDAQRPTIDLRRVPWHDGYTGLAVPHGSVFSRQ